jgi:hypothetical protein
MWEIAARLKARSFLRRGGPGHAATPSTTFGWKDLDEGEIKGHAKYYRGTWPGRALRERPRPACPRACSGIAVAPLGSVDGLYEPDTVHFDCDTCRPTTWPWTTGRHRHPPPAPTITMNSSACGGNVQSLLAQEFNMLPACSGSYNAGKTERGEINVIIPGKKFPAVMARLMAASRPPAAPSPGPATASPAPTSARTARSSCSRRTERAPGRGGGGAQAPPLHPPAGATGPGPLSRAVSSGPGRAALRVCGIRAGAAKRAIPAGRIGRNGRYETG